MAGTYSAQGYAPLVRDTCAAPTPELYQDMLSRLFVRFPSVQMGPFAQAYKPGLEHMESFARMLGDPHLRYASLHVAGTNGKGSVSTMLASVLRSCGYKVGLYTSPHISDFRERIRVDGDMVPWEWVYRFVARWQNEISALDLSFFEITTGMAMAYFLESGVDVAVFEVGLGGRLDSTNILDPILSVVTSIGLDHTAYLGDTPEAIASEKAGIFKPGKAAVAGHVQDSVREVLRRKASAVGCSLHCVDTDPFPPQVSELAVGRGSILREMDLAGSYQSLNLCTVLYAVGVLRKQIKDFDSNNVDNTDLNPPADSPRLLPPGPAREAFMLDAPVRDGIVHAARAMALRGRWERMTVGGRDYVLDIGHNPQALEFNFQALQRYVSSGQYGRIVVVYAVMADKDLPSIIPLMPAESEFVYIFTTPSTPRALPSELILEAVESYRSRQGFPPGCLYSTTSLPEALSLACFWEEQGRGEVHTLTYIGGSTFAVADALAVLGGPDPPLPVPPTYPTRS